MISRIFKKKYIFLIPLQQPQSQNGHDLNHGDAEVVDIKDVELTLLPSYLHESNSPQDNTDLLESISKPNVQSSPPKRPPRSNQSPEGKWSFEDSHCGQINKSVFFDLVCSKSFYLQTNIEKYYRRTHFK